jgi:hypothetical protein
MVLEVWLYDLMRFHTFVVVDANRHWLVIERMEAVLGIVLANQFLRLRVIFGTKLV